MEKKEITSKTAVRAIITGFASYGIILLFIYKIIEVFVQKTILNEFSIDQSLLYVVFAAIFSILILVGMHLLCRLSTYDVFRKCKIKKEDVDKVSKSLSKIFISTILISIILTFTFLYLNLMYETRLQKQSVILANLQYNKTYSEEFTTKLTNQMISDFSTYRSNLIAYTFVIELGFTISLIAIVPFQKTMINKYNT